MKTLTTISETKSIRNLLTILLVLINFQTSEAANYTNLFSDPSSYQVSCSDNGGQTSNAKWKLNTKDSCVFSTPAITVCGSQINYQFEIKNTGNSTVNDLAYFQHRIGNSSWVTDTMVNGYDVHNGGGTAINLGVLLNVSPSIEFRIICVIESNSGAWEIESGKVNFSYSPCMPLYVEFGSFLANSDGKAVQLEWSTFSEKNSDYFTIQRTTDGINFENVGFLKSNGNSSLPSHYRFTDEKPIQGYSYYRISETDNDGLVAYPSPTLVVFHQVSENDFEMYPNPLFGKELSINFGSNQALTSEVMVTILSLQSVVIATYKMTMGKDQSKVIVEIQENLSPGYYIVQAENNGIKFSRKILVSNSIAI